MKAVVYRFETPLIDMRIDLGRRDICMAEQLLNDPQIGAITQQMRGK